MGYWLERWTAAAKERGTRALDSLRGGVEQAIQTLGEGFLAHPANTALKDALRQGSLTKQDFYREILRLVYRLIFLFAAEDRGLLFVKDAAPEAKTLYQQFYSAGHLRRLAERRRGTRHPDLYRSLKMVMQHLGSDAGCPALGLPALGSYLWSKEAVSHLAEADIHNTYLLSAVRHLGFTVQGKVLRAVDYKNLGAEELGSIYESLLELHPQVDSNAATFELKTAAGHERKTTGSYYTPSSLILGLLDSALEPVLDRAARSKEPERAILGLKVCDPACGSGHFLIAAAHRIAKRLAAVRTGDDEPSPEATRNALRDVIGHCIYGVDINPMPVELCKVGLWLEALVPGKALSFLDHHIQCGNSLLGCTPALIAKGIPDEALTLIEGDEKEITKALVKRNKDERKHKGQREFFDFTSGSPLAISSETKETLERIELAADDSPVAVRKKAEAYGKLSQSKEFTRAKLIADAWCAAFVWLKRPEAPEAITQAVFERLSEEPNSVAQPIRDEITRLASQYGFFHFHLAFPEVFAVLPKAAPDNQATGWSGGFSVVLGNPPWERIKIQEQEFFATSAPEIANAKNAAERKRMISALEQDHPTLFHAFGEALRESEGSSHFLRDSGRFPLAGRGDINTYSVFAETMRQIISIDGRVGCIIPSGIATDDTTKAFFQDLMDSNALLSLYEFENEGFFGAGKGHMVRFALCTIRHGRPSADGPVKFMFQGKAVSDLKNPERIFSITSSDLAVLSPNNGICPIFQTNRDLKITQNIYGRFPVLIRETEPPHNPWHISFLRMFDMATDSGLFHGRGELEEKHLVLKSNIFAKGSTTFLPLWESKLIYQHDYRYGDFSLLPPGSKGHVLPMVPYDNLADSSYSPMPRYWVASSELAKRIPEDWAFNWLLGWRDVTDSRASARTLISTTLPRYGCGHSLPLLLPRASATSIACLAGSLNSFIVDYLARQRVGGLHLTYHVFKQLPILPPTTYHADLRWLGTGKLSAWIARRVLELVYVTDQLQGFGRDLGFDGPPFKFDGPRRFAIRCELDAAFFHLYGIGCDDAAYIMDTFPIIKKEDEKEFGEYRTKRTVLEIFDSMKHAMESGKPYRSPLDPPPGDQRGAHRGVPARSR